jgi:hypothetical protein
MLKKIIKLNFNLSKNNILYKIIIIYFNQLS